MLKALIAYDANGNIVGTLDYMSAKDEEGNVIGLIDFEAHENAGGKLRDIWTVETAVGSAVWPEWIGTQAHDFKVELDANKRAVVLVHKRSGHRRERQAIEAEISSRVEQANGAPADLRDLLGGPNRPLKLDAEGRNQPRVAKSPRPALPVVRRAQPSPSATSQPEDEQADRPEHQTGDKTGPAVVSPARGTVQPDG